MANDVSSVPLFDRLVDAEKWTPRETKPYRAMDRAALRLSVATEVERLLNTRCSLSVDEAAEKDPSERTVLDYGVPDMSWVNPMTDEGGKLLKAAVQNALIAYEPRLRDPKVQVIGLDSRQRTVVVSIGGALVLGRIEEPFSFAIALEQGSQAPVKVEESNAA